jgi:hypothetical protein
LVLGEEVGQFSTPIYNLGSVEFTAKTPYRDLKVDAIHDAVASGMEEPVRLFSEYLEGRRGPGL